LELSVLICGWLWAADAVGYLVVVEAAALAEAVGAQVRVSTKD
jgi:hypothetical protein